MVGWCIHNLKSVLLKFVLDTGFNMSPAAFTKAHWTEALLELGVTDPLIKDLWNLVIHVPKKKDNGLIYQCPHLTPTQCQGLNC